MEIPLDGLEREISHIELVYPASLPCEYRYYRETGKLVVRQPEKSARLFKIDWK